jgi:diguanylate cyclase (GGDEF)-like protein
MNVILVGEIGVETEGLQPSPAVHVATPLEALGELGRRLTGSPMMIRQPIAVVLAQDVTLRLASTFAAPIPGRVRGSAAPVLAGQSELEQFVAGLRKVDPTVKVVGVGQVSDPALMQRFGKVFDVVVSPPAQLADILGALEGKSSGAPTLPAYRAQPRPVGDGEESTEEDAPDEPNTSDSVANLLVQFPVSELGDAPVLEALLAGGDVISAAMRVVSARLNGGTFRLVPTAEGAPLGPSAPVKRDDSMFGYLAGPAEPSVLAKHAAWLGLWLHVRELHHRLRRAAFTDPLTGAWNRRYFDRFLAAAMNNARLQRRHVTVLVFDIDDFKHYNDRYGHGAGDDILREVVKLIRSVIRPTDRVCRIGGDEFAVVFHDPQGPRQPGSISNVSVVEMAQRFRAQIAEHRFPKLGDRAAGTLSISGGMASFPWDGGTPTELLARADELAMEAKRSGKNVVTFGKGAVRASER